VGGPVEDREDEMRKLLAALVLTSVAAMAWFLSSLAAAQTPADVLEARVGDRIRVVDAPIGCRVVRMRQLGGRVVIDCRRTGALTGTYGTLFSAREALLVEFKSRGTAKRRAEGVHFEPLEKCGLE
jgi:hypothetical protein